MFPHKKYLQLVCFCQQEKYHSDKLLPYYLPYLYSCTVQFAEDGVYQFQCAYKDKAGNVSDMVVSDILVIDNTLPLIQASYADKKNKMGIYCNTSGVLHIDITEENFSKEFVEVILHNQKSAKKINLKVPWNKTAGHLYKATYQIQEDGMY